MQKLLLICILVVLAGCQGSSSSDAAAEAEAAGPTPEEMAAKQLEDDQKLCVNNAMRLIYSDPRDDYSISRRIAAADLTKCPSDFSMVFVDLRQKFNRAMEFQQQLSAHKQQGDQALGAGATLSFLEWLSESDSGLTPFSDWVQRDQQFAQEASAISAELRRAFDSLEVSAAAYGTTLSTAPVAEAAAPAAQDDAMSNAK
jgi:hypothetical protein